MRVDRKLDRPRERGQAEGTPRREQKVFAGMVILEDLATDHECLDVGLWGYAFSCCAASLRSTAPIVKWPTSLPPPGVGSRRVRARAQRPGYCKLTGCRGRRRPAVKARRRGRHPARSRPRRHAVSLPAGNKAVTRQPGLPRSSQISPRAMCERPWSRRCRGDHRGRVRSPGPFLAADNFHVQPALRAANAVDRVEQKRQRPGLAFADQRGQARRMPDQAGGRDQDRSSLDFSQAIVFEVIPELARSTMTSAIPRLGCSSRAPSESTNW